MSMQSTIIYGHGFEIHGEDKALIAFISNHRKTIKQLCRGEELLKYIADGGCTVIDDFFDMECEESGREGVYSIVSNVMRLETGIRFQYEPGDCECGSTDTILLAECMPWQMNDREKELTEEDLDAIVKKYVDELGIVTTQGFLGVEYYG